MDPETAQISMFKDAIARRILKLQTDQQSGDGEPAMDDFVSYLASESWPTLPLNIKEATHDKRDIIPDVETITFDSTSIDFVDSLVSYSIVSDPDGAYEFLRKTVADYLDQACSPPPIWSSTRTKECEICLREVPLTYHHLIPRSTHGKVIKKGWHSKTVLNSVAWLCRPCHSAVHHVASNEDLARYFYTVDLLLARDDIQKWKKYAAKQRFGVRRG
ncbi:hypothetical protein BDN70DRAFT_839542 [Pholiota conissans]|uniref:HNH nuclease domain-containing protein n=1 Tax=Pholiota conissans TaxID=109636 RepID=A0A9P5YUZ6_9AGAR|nr:hypothetical protein BDN70DRAFT_839542 [Pholiota conissans]